MARTEERLEVIIARMEAEQAEQARRREAFENAYIQAIENPSEEHLEAYARARDAYWCERERAARGAV